MKKFIDDDLIWTVLRRIESHTDEQAKRIDRDVDSKLFVQSILKYRDGFYDSAASKMLSNIDETVALKYCLIKMGLSREEVQSKDSFFKGKANTMDLLAYETAKQVLESELKKAGGDNA